MNSQRKEQLYLVLMVICLTMCVILLFSVLSGRPIGGRQPLPPHTPTIRLSAQISDIATQLPGTASSSSIVISEQQLADGMLSFLPDSFPSDSISADIEVDGTIELEFSASRSDLVDFVESIGGEISLGHKLLMTLLPDELETSIAIKVEGMENGLLTISLASFELDDNEINAQDVPIQITEIVNGALNSLISLNDIPISEFSFTDDAVVLR